MKYCKNKRFNSKTYFYYGDEDVTLNYKKVDKVLNSKNIEKINFNYKKIPGFKHIFLYEEDSYKVFEEIREIVNSL